MQYFSEDYFTTGSTPAALESLATLPVLGLPVVDAKPLPVARHLLGAKRASAFFLNAHCANVCASNRHYAAALARADFILPDGIGVELAAKMTGQALTANLNGTDFVPLLLREAARIGKSVYLFGGTEGTAEAAADRLCFDIPGLRIVGTKNGFEQAIDEDAVVADINASGADIVIVAMGVPRQELWIDRNRKQLKADLVLGVGALLDFLAGNVRRAPKIVRKAKMEWVWRLAMEPRRMAKRYLIGNATFMARAARAAVHEIDRTDLAQRGVDIVVSGTALLLLGLPMLLIAALIRADSKGPALFHQTRIGRDGKPFKFYKFRSMRVDAEKLREQLLASSDREGLCFKSRNDPRITRLGRILRRTSLDELPQLLNVFKGQMSIVGPRPALPEEVAAYPERAMGRLKVRPGITGIWQVSGRASIGFEKMIDMDIAYIRSRSVLLDLVIMALTFRAVVSGRGAY